MTTRARFAGALSALLCGGIALLLLPRLILFAQFNAAVLAWPWQFDYDEGVNLHAASLLARAQDIYLPNPADHFISAPYPPVLYLLSVPFIWLGGVQLTALRALMLLVTLAIAGLLVFLARRLAAGWLQAALSGLLWLTISPVIIWATLYKQDMLGLAFGLAGLAVVLRWPDDRRRYWAVALFALAFFTKQSALAPAAAATLWLILRDRRGGLRFAAALAGTVGVVFVALLGVSRGGFWDHAILYQDYPWLTRFWERLIDRLLGEYWPLLGIGLLTILVALGSAWRMRRHPKGRVPGPWALAVLYAVMAAGSISIQTGYPGANNNHLLDIFPPLCWLAGGALGYLSLSAGWRRRVALVGLYGALVVQTAVFGNLDNWYDAGYWPSATRADELASRSALVRNADGPVYSEDAGLLLLNGHDPIYDDPHTAGAMGDAGRWDETRLDQDLRDRRFPYVFIRHDAWQWSQQAGQAFADSYDLAFAGTLDVYKPKIYPARAQYTLDCDLGTPAELQLTGYSLGPGVSERGAAAGSVLQLALYWRAARPANDYATFVHLLDATGRQVAARDNSHSATGQPTSRWAVGTDVVEITDLPLPANLAPGVYHLIGGVYGTAGGGIMSVAVDCPDTARQVGGAIDLGAITVP